MEKPSTGQKWLDKHFYLPQGSSQKPGRWKTQPSQIVLANIIGNDAVREVCVQKPARWGYSKIVAGMNMYFAAHKKRSGVYYGPTDPYVKRFVKTEIDPLLPVMPVIQEIFPEWKKKGSGKNKDTYKHIGVAHWDYLGAATSNNFMGLTKQVVILDESSRIARDVDGEGSVRHVVKRRLEGAAFPTFVNGSSPTIDGEDDLQVMMDEMDIVLEMHLPCPYCDTEQTLKWGGKDCDFGIYFDDEGSLEERAESARYECENPNCREHISYNQLKPMQLQGRWVCEKTGIWTEDGIDFYGSDGKKTKTPKKVGIKCNALYSLNLTDGWSGLVREWLDIKGDPLKLKVFTNTILGEFWIELNTNKIDWEVLFNRREVWVGRVPREAVYITAGVDTQGHEGSANNRLEGYVYAWGANEESWLIDSWVVYGNLATNEPWDEAIELLNQSYQHALGFEMPISTLCWDSGGGFTSQVHAACRKGGIKKFLPIRGAPSGGKPIADMPKRVNKKHKTYFFEVGTEAAKDTIYGRYRIQRNKPGEPTPGYIHLPADDEICDEKAVKEFVAETKVMKFKNGVRTSFWECPKHVSNEGTDCANYALAALKASKQRKRINLEVLSAKQLGTSMPKSKKTKKHKKAGSYGGV
jgi:phage terminase large subunit GpA-like protein